MIEPIDADQSDWLEAHLSGCAECRATAEGYARDRLLLRSLREPAPVPPRDLWARTALAIEREAARSTAPRSGRGARRRRSVLPLGIASGVLVIAVVVSASLLSGGYGLLNGNPNGPISGLASALPGATPITVAAQGLNWLQTGRNGDYDLYFAAIDEVCPATDKPACAPLGDTGGRTIKLPNAPRSVVISPTSAELVVVSSDSQAGGGSVIVLVLPSVAPTPTSPSSTPVAVTSQSPGAPSKSASTAAGASVGPSSAPAQSPGASTSSTPFAGATPGAGPSSSAASASAGAPSSRPHGSTAPSGPPSVGTEIATNVIVVGGSGAYSPDGRWFAFSARPADGSNGPDIYLWRVGAPAATTVTSDHRSVFSTWVGGSILGSRVTVGAETGAHSAGPGASGPAASAAASAKSQAPAAASHATSFLLDPTTLVAVDLGGALWRPVVDPTGGRVVYWDGTLELEPNGVSWHPASGHIVLGPWSNGGIGPAGTTPSAASGAPQAGSGAPSTHPTSASGRAGSTAALQVLAEGPFSDFDARFDPTGSRLALWTADPATATVGRLSLFVIDPATGAVDTSAAPLPGVPALRGFSIDRGRLAWVTPPGQDGQDSRVQVMGWTGDSFGSIETVPAHQLLVVR